MIVRALRADAALLLVAISWGLTFPVIEDSVKYTDPYWFVVLRIAVAALILLPFVLPKISQTTRRILFAGMVLGLLNGITYVCQSIGLETTSAAMSGFVTGTNVIMVPLLLPFFTLGLPRRIDIAGCFICLGGLYILTGANWQHISVGELWTLVGAFSYALTIVYLQKVTRENNHTLLLAFYQIVFVIPWVIITPLWQHRPLFLNETSWVGIIVTGVLATSIALLLQTRYQRETTATRAVIIFSLEPVFAVIFGWLINQEPVTRNIIIGGSIILLSLLMVELVPRLVRHWRMAQTT